MNKITMAVFYCSEGVHIVQNKEIKIKLSCLHNKVTVSGDFQSFMTGHKTYKFDCNLQVVALKTLWFLHNKHHLSLYKSHSLYIEALHKARVETCSFHFLFKTSNSKEYILALHWMLVALANRRPEFQDESHLIGSTLEVEDKANGVSFTFKPVTDLNIRCTVRLGPKFLKHHDAQLLTRWSYPCTARSMFLFFSQNSVLYSAMNFMDSLQQLNKLDKYTRKWFSTRPHYTGTATNSDKRLELTSVVTEHHWAKLGFDRTVNLLDYRSLLGELVLAPINFETFFTQGPEAAKKEFANVTPFIQVLRDNTMDKIKFLSKS